MTEIKFDPRVHKLVVKEIRDFGGKSIDESIKILKDTEKQVLEEYEGACHITLYLEEDYSIYMEFYIPRSKEEIDKYDQQLLKMQKLKEDNDYKQYLRLKERFEKETNESS